MGLLFLGIPLLGMLVYLNFMIILKRLKNGQDIHNYTMIGSLLVFIFLFAVTIGVASLH